MRDFRHNRSRLRRLPIGPRLVYTSYLTFALVGLLVAAVLYQKGPTLSPTQAARYYAGGDDVAEGRASASADRREPSNPPTDEAANAGGASRGGPVLELDGLGDPVDPTMTPLGPSWSETSAPSGSRPTGQRIPVRYDTRRLIEVTHGHVFMMPLVLLVISHLFLLTGVGRAMAGLVVGVATVGVAAHLAAPWLIRDVSVGWAFLLPASGLTIAISLGGMAFASLVVMWWPAGPRRGG